MNDHKVVDLVAKQTGKRVATKYAISIPAHYREKILVGFRGIGSAEFFRQHTDELWTPPFCELTCAQYGAFRRIRLRLRVGKKILKVT